jgi:hypothetical protein
MIANVCWIPVVAAAEETGIPSEGYHQGTSRLQTRQELGWELSLTHCTLKTRSPLALKVCDILVVSKMSFSSVVLEQPREFPSHFVYINVYIKQMPSGCALIVLNIKKTLHNTEIRNYNCLLRCTLFVLCAG